MGEVLLSFAEVQEDKSSSYFTSHISHLTSHIQFSKLPSSHQVTSESYSYTTTMVEFTVFKGSKEGKIYKAITKKDLKPDKVLIKVTHSGLCGTDEHYRRADIVLGHEGAGIVEASLLLSMCQSLSNGDIGNWNISQEYPQRRFRRLGVSTQFLQPLQAMPHRPRNSLP
jgi:hypothetical protein